MSSPASAGTSGPPRMPVLFVGHGSPMNAVEDNRWSRALRAVGASLPRPRAILCVSAHWVGDGTRLTADERPETIHDFGGFPPELYEVRYPAPGDPALARRVAGLLAGWNASTSAGRGLDHGAWGVLVHLSPEADVPVVQLGMDARLGPADHLAVGRALAPLRDEGVLLVASGNLVHDLRHAFSAARRGERATPAWAREFDEEIADALARHDWERLVRAPQSELGRRAAPTPEHYLPILYAAGASGRGDRVRFPVTGFDMSSLSMRSVVLG